MLQQEVKFGTHLGTSVLDADLVVAKTEQGTYNVSIMTTGNGSKELKRSVERWYTQKDLSASDLMLYAVNLRDNFRNVAFTTDRDKALYDEAYRETRVVK